VPTPSVALPQMASSTASVHSRSRREACWRRLWPRHARSVRRPPWCHRGPPRAIGPGVANARGRVSRIRASSCLIRGSTRARVTTSAGRSAWQSYGCGLQPVEPALVRGRRCAVRPPSRVACVAAAPRRARRGGLAPRCRSALRLTSGRALAGVGRHPDRSSICFAPARVLVTWKLSVSLDAPASLR
jgi:hypothetical protein